jgi:diguanylate cyclase (GGDEF)-like protein
VADTRQPTEGALSVLTTGAAAVARGADLDATLAALLGTAVKALAADVAAVWLQDPDRIGLELVGTIGLDDTVIDALRGGVIKHGSSVPPPQEGFVDVVGVTRAEFRPLIASRGGIDEPGGVIAVGWKTAPPGPDDDAILSAVADLAAAAADRHRLATMVAERSEWFERMAHSDPLTGLANSRTFGRVLELELARASRQGSAVSVAIFDVDGFTATNAESGNEAGDDVLRMVASVIAESVRLVDTVARYGGDEFVLVAPGSAGSVVARRILDGVAKLQPVDGRTISVSAGIARFPADGTDAAALIIAAQDALTRVQAEGPGRIGETANATRGESGS